MKEDIFRWNEKHEWIEAKNNKIYFKEGEVWWAHLGVNIGYEMNGKGTNFARPVIVLKKYNQFSFLALPLSTANKINKYRISVGIIEGKESYASMSQIRNIDSRRLMNKIARLEPAIFAEIKEKTSRANFG